MQEINLTFTQSIQRTETVFSFRFTPSEKIDFLPGQFLEVIFDQQDRKNRTLNKYLSFSCAPGKEYIEITKRLTGSEFSDRLKGLRAGDTVLIKAPMGRCVFKDEYQKVGFLIGGIGITPVISMLEYIVEKSLPTDVCLIYSNKTEDDIAFKKELEQWSNSGNIKVINTVVSCEPEDKKCFFGRIDKQFLLDHACDYRERRVFIFGPPAMVDAMKELSLAIGCKEEMVMTENFIGY